MAESRLTADSMYLLKSLSSNLDSEAMLDEEIELTLGLSLNGFGVDPPKLARSSSMNPYTSVESAAGYVANGNLMRTCSLPVEPEEEVMKRKEMQSLRRMEAKRKRIEKQRNMSLRAAIPLKPEKRVSKGGLRSEKSRVSSSHFQGISPSESQIIQGMCKSVEPIEQMQMESESDRKVELVGCPSLGTRMKNQFNQLTVSDNQVKESSLVKNAMLDMPCVSTQGDGPDGKRIEGLLYRYNKSEEVRIVCVCHGKFMSPAEFVKHAGGTDFEQPLKHIVVTPSSQCLYH